MQINSSYVCIYIYTHTHKYIYNVYKFLAWNSSWRSPIHIIQYDNDMIITCHSWLVLSCICSQWAHCSAFKYLANARGNSCSTLQKPSNVPRSTWIDLLRGDHVCYEGLFVYVICAAAVSYMLTAACFGCISSNKSRYYIYIYIYIYTQYLTKVSTPLTFRQSI